MPVSPGKREPDMDIVPLNVSTLDWKDRLEEPAKSPPLVLNCNELTGPVPGAEEVTTKLPSLSTPK